MNVSEIPQTPEKIVISLGIIFAIILFVGIGFAIYKTVIDK